MSLTHHQKATAIKLWQSLEDARNLVAASRGSIFLVAANVDEVTLSVVRLQDIVLECLRKDERPEEQKMVWPK